MKVFLALCLLLSWSVCPSKGFVPNSFLEAGVRLNCLDFDSFDNHQEISENAIRAVAEDVLADNPSFGNGEDSSLEDAIETINIANAGVDFGPEQTVAAAHFDSEQFQLGQNRLVTIRQAITSLIRNQNFEMARMETGRMFHALQDFYSHSNWIESGNRSPYNVLGEEDQRPGPVAAPTTQTCTDCERSGTVVLLTVINFFRGLFSDDDPENAESFYTCPDNIHSDIQESKELTSGYASAQTDNTGQVIEKPSGKCSHGGALDATADLSARGGINKDSPCEKWSPHYYLYDVAIQVAQQATVDMLQKLRRDVNDEALFGRYLGLDVVQTVSIAYVIDTSASMAGALPEIQATIPSIRTELQQYVDSLQGDVLIRYILVTYNNTDPGTIFETKDIDRFLAGIEGLSADESDNPGGEPTIGAIIQAIETSELRSPIFVYTDAPPSDTHRLNYARALITRKRVRLTFVYPTPVVLRRKRSQDYGAESHMKRTVPQTIDYEVLAAFSGGQFLYQRTNEISDLASLISFLTIGNRRTILRRFGLARGTSVYSFPVDSTIGEIVISINGVSITPVITTPQGLNVNILSQFTPSLVSSTSYIASIVITNDSLRGEWTLNLTTSGYFTIQVMGRSQLRFFYELFSIAPSNIYGLRAIDGKPAQGSAIVVEFEFEGDTFPANVTTLNLIDDQGITTQSSDNVTRSDEANYMTAFIPTSLRFAFQLVGTDKRGYSFSYIGDTAVEVTAIDLALGENTIEFVTIRPEEGANVTLVLENRGDTSQFDVTVNIALTDSLDNTRASDVFKYVLTPGTVNLVQNELMELNLEISALSSNITDGITATFTIVAESTSYSDFVTIFVITSTKPPPEFNENLVSGAVVFAPIHVMVVELLVTSLLWMVVEFLM